MESEELWATDGATNVANVYSVRIGIENDRIASVA